MRKAMPVTLFALCVGVPSVRAQDNPGQDRATSGAAKPLILVNAFATTKEVVWPYDMKELQKQTVAELYAKVGKECEVAAELPAPARGHVFSLNGEVTSWRPGNRVKRMLVGMLRKRGRRDSLLADG